METKNLQKYVNNSDISKGKKYDKNKVSLIEKNFGSGKQYVLFNVRSERTAGRYGCMISLDEDKQIDDIHCSCPQFAATNSCKHIAACLINYSYLFEDAIEDNSVLKLFSLFDTGNVINKSLVMFEISIEAVNAYRGIRYYIRGRIGDTKLYSITNKLSSFIKDVHGGYPHKLGANFTYNKNKYYFSEVDNALIEFLYKYGEAYGGEVYVTEDRALELFNILKKREFNFFDKTIIKHKNELPLAFNMKKKDDNYDIEILRKCDLEIVTSDFSILCGDDTFYYLNDKETLLLRELLANNFKSISFKKSDLNIFSKTLYKVIKDKINIKDEETEKKLVEVIPEIKLYFDINGFGVKGKFVLTYNGVDINYFDKSDFLRNEEIENNVVKDLLDLGFAANKEQFLLNDVLLEAEFLERGLEFLNTKYKVFTSENFKNASVLSNERVTSNFSIGQDNILNFDFDMGHIDNDEIDKVMASLREKKKYYRLKNGSILNLEEQSDLNELDTFLESSDISFKDVKNGGVMPKYRALYLDSVKDKYSFIKTDNLFDQFINNFKSNIGVNVELSLSEKKLLRDYQEVGVEWLYKIDKLGFGGILADEMGLGKTLEVLIFIRHLIMEDSNNQVLIVVPTSLAYNWEREILKFTKELQYTVVLGNKNMRSKKLLGCKSNIIITTYGLLREDQDLYKDMKFRVMFIDEAQNIKNPGARLTKAVKSINAETKFALTGTPLENSVMELWSIFDFIMPGLLANYARFSSRYKNINLELNTTMDLLENLNRMIEPFILRRRKSDVVKDLPKKIENNIFLDLSDEQKVVYKDELDKVKDEVNSIMKRGTFETSKIMILRLLTRLREICISPKLLYDNYKGGSKIDSLADILNGFIANGHKVLLFSSFKSSLDLVSLELEKNDISYYRIDGGVASKVRMDLVDKFNGDDTNVFMITLKAGGTGLNLVGADVVIHLDLWWNPQVEAQATDRAHRIGQKNNVEVVKLICKGTIEEKILDLQNKKKILSDKLIENTNPDIVISKLSENDIKNLLSYENE